MPIYSRIWQIDLVKTFVRVSATGREIERFADRLRGLSVPRL